MNAENDVTTHDRNIYLPNSTEKLSDPEPYWDFKMTVLYVQFYFTAFIIWLGLVFNILAITCLVTSHTLRRTTTALLIISLTSADIIFLVGDALRWKNFVIDHKHFLGMKFIEEYNFFCKTVYFLRYFGKLTSAWMIVAITLERYINIAHPLKAAEIATRRNSHIVIVTTYVVCAALTLFPFWTIGVVDDATYGIKYCSYLDRIEYNIWNWMINRIGSLLLPCIIIFVATIVIILKLHHMDKLRMSLTEQVNINSNIQRQFTLMLVAVALAFLLLRLPYMLAYYLYDFRESIWDPVTPVVEKNLFTAYKLTDIFETTNYSINFFMYCLTGNTFRSQFVSLMCCRYTQLQRPRAASVQNTLDTSMKSLHKISPANSKLSINVVGANDVTRV